MAAAITATVAVSTVAPHQASAFYDVSSKYEEAVEYLRALGIKGFSSTHFGVDEQVKRVDAAVMLATALDLDLNAAPYSGFQDVPKRAEKHINALKAAGITNGTSATTFNSNAIITRGEMAIMLERAFHLSGTSELPFNDVPDRYKASVVALYDNNVTKGISYSKFGTGLALKRGDFANFLLAASRAETGLRISNARYVSASQVQVTLNKAADKLSIANFHIEGLTIKSAKIDGNKRTATLTVNGMEFDREYTVKAENVMVKGELSPVVSNTFVSAAAEDVYQLSITHKGLKENKDRTTETELTIELINKETGKVERNSSGVILDLSTTSGELAQTNVPLKSGTAKVKAVFPPNGRVSTPVITARVTSGAGIYSGLVGTISGSLSVTVNPTIDSTPFTLTNVKGYLNGSGRDTIILTFSEGVQLTGTHNATNRTQYILNGNSLPYGTTITVQDGNGNTDDGFEVVIISLPNDTLNSGSNSIKIKDTLQSYDNTVISEPISRYFTVEDDWNGTSINEVGTFTGNVHLKPDPPSSGSPLRSVTYGPTTGLRTINGDVVIKGHEVDNITLKNIKINGNLYVQSPVNSINALATVTITGETRIQTTASNPNGDVYLKNRGNLATVWIDYNTLGTTIINESSGRISTVMVNTDKPVTLEGSITNVNLQVFTTVYIWGAVSNLAAYQSGVINGTGRISSITGPSHMYLTGDNPYLSNASAVARFNAERNRILARNLIPTEYTRATWQALQNALGFDVRNKNNNQIQQATTVLLTAESGLRVNNSDPDYIIEKEELNDLINDLQDLHDDAVEGIELGQYRAGSKRALQTAIYDARSVWNNSNVTLSEIRAAKQHLSDAEFIFISNELKN